MEMGVQAECGVTLSEHIPTKIPDHACLFLSLPDRTTALGTMFVYWGNHLNQIKSRSRENADNQMRHCGIDYGDRES